MRQFLTKLRGWLASRVVLVDVLAADRDLIRRPTLVVMMVMMMERGRDHTAAQR